MVGEEVQKDDLVLSTELIMQIGCCEEPLKLMIQALALPRNDLKTQTY